MEVRISSGGGEKSKVSKRIPGLWDIVSVVFIIVMRTDVQQNSFLPLLNRQIEVDRHTTLLLGRGIHEIPTISRNLSPNTDVAVW